MQERENLLNWNMGKLFSKLAIPGMLGMLVIGLYNFADAIFVGQLVGEDAVGAVALLYSVVLFNQGILTLVGGGSMSLLSIAVGKKDQDTIDKLLGNLVAFILVASGIFTIVTYIFSDEIVTFIGGRGEVHVLAVRYLKILLIGFIPAALGPAMNFLVRGEGKMKAAMTIAGLSGALNIILDPIFIKYFNFGIEGAAIATVISQMFFMVSQIIYFKMGKSIITFNNFKIRFQKNVFSDVLKLGSSQMFMCFMAMIQQIFLFRALENYGGNSHVALMGGIFRLFLFAYLAVWGIGQGLQPLVGVNYGAKRYDRVKLGFKTFTMIGFIMTSICWILFMIYPNFFLSLFIKDHSLVLEGTNLFRIFNIIFFAYIYFATSLNLFIGLGKAKEAGILAISRQIVFFIPLVLILPKFVGVIGVWLSIPLADALTMLVGAYFNIKIFKEMKYEINNSDKLDAAI